MVIKLTESNNIFEDIFLDENLRNRTTLLNIDQHPGNMGGQFKNIYFYRYIGFENKEEYLAKLQQFRKRLIEDGCKYLEFNKRIEQPYNMKLTEKVSEALNKIPELQFRKEQGRDILSLAGAFDISSNKELNILVRNSFKTIMELYYENEPIPTLSIEKNFIIKLFLWIHELVPRLIDGKQTLKLPKVIYYGGVKKHEIYFLIMLSLLGCDVLLLSSEGQGEYLKVDKSGTYSKVKSFSQTGIIEYSLENIKLESTQAVAVNIHQNHGSGSFRGNGNEDIARIVLKDAIHIFDDIYFPLRSRVGYVGLPSPVLPVYFYRYIGFSGEELTAEDEYYNSIYVLDKKLSNLECGYVKFINNVPPPMPDEVEVVSKRFTGLKNFDPKDKNKIIYDIERMGLIGNVKDPIFTKFINTAFEKVMDLYLTKEASVNAARLQSFVYKLLVWINRYYKLLFRNNAFYESPKILYYGDIKAHEIYLLIFLNNIGCDVLYLTTEEYKDKPFLEIDEEEKFTKLLVNERNEPMQEFPEVERTIRKTTTAFNASRELDRMIYNDDVGLYRPWQFEDYDIRAVTLRTTYDELKLLWREDAKIRPEFKTQNGTVYVPNLFAKISGTHEELEKYWLDYKLLAKGPSTCEFINVPFTKAGFSRQDIYSMAFLIDRNGNLNKEELVSSQYFKFNYLRTSLRNLLVDKLQELMKSDCFVTPADNNFRLLILITILTINEELLKLIETFDYPQCVPKIVVYNNKKDGFSDEDSIIIAFLNSIGFDIAIFTPTNYNTIEQKLKEAIYDKFQLPSIQYELEIPSGIHSDINKGKSIFSRIFGL